MVLGMVPHAASALRTLPGLTVSVLLAAFSAGCAWSPATVLQVKGQPSDQPHPLPGAGPPGAGADQRHLDLMVTMNRCARLRQQAEQGMTSPADVERVARRCRQASEATRSPREYYLTQPQ
jgi:hypothetical protein